MQAVPAGASSELVAVFGKQRLETGTDQTRVLFPIHATTSRVTDYHRFSVTVGVSLAQRRERSDSWGDMGHPSKAPYRDSAMASSQNHSRCSYGLNGRPSCRLDGLKWRAKARGSGGGGVRNGWCQT